MRSVISSNASDVALDRLTAPGVELGDAVGLDVGLAGEAQLLLDGDLHRQPVAVPAGLAGDVVALHRPVAGEDVLEDPRLDVMGAGQAVGRRGTLVERPLWPAFAQLERSSEGVVLAPERQDLPLHGRKSTWLGTGRYVGTSIASRFLRRSRLPTEGRGPARSTGGPAVPPSLAASTCTTTHSVACGRFYSGVRPFLPAAPG